jgi:hypothetical protein
MKIYVVGSSKNKFLPLDNIREKFLIDQPHEGDNIDFLNPWYCELTGLYYLWKHVDDDIVGLEHYRRYFVNNKGKLLSENEIYNLMKSCEIITPLKQYRNNIPIKTWPIQNKIWVDFQKFLCFIKHYVNEEYYKSCLNVLNNNKHYYANMIICKKEILNQYCEFIFDVLKNFRLAEAYYNRKLTPRILGYFTEFLFKAWADMMHKNVKICNYKLVM